MIEALGTLTAMQWGIGVATLAGFAVLGTLLFGRDRVASWVEAVWKRRTAPPPR